MLPNDAKQTMREALQEYLNDCTVEAYPERLPRVRAALAALGAADAGVYVPLADGDYELEDGNSTYILHVSSNGEMLEQWNKNNTFKDGSPVEAEEVWLGDYRLCKVSVGEEALARYSHRNGEAIDPEKYGPYWVELPVANGNPCWDIWWWNKNPTTKRWFVTTSIKPLAIYGPIDIPPAPRPAMREE